MDPANGSGAATTADGTVPETLVEVHPTSAEYAELELTLDGALTGSVAVTVPAEHLAESELDLTDAEGTPVARLTVTDRDGDRLVGKATPLADREDGVFRHLRRRPVDVLTELAALTGLTAGEQRPAAVRFDVAPDAESRARLEAAVADYPAVVLLPPATENSARVVRAAVAFAEGLQVEARVVPVPPVRPARSTEVVAAFGDPVEVALTPEPVPPGRRGLVVFFTGLSGSGKSTIARRLRDRLLERSERSVTLLDGDVVRRMLSAGLGFSPAGREANIRRIGYVAAEVGRAGGIAICAPIAPFEATRAEVRRMATEAGADFVLVHVSTPLAECERRDRKGLYAKARRGEIGEFTGISQPYEAPTDADLTIDTTDVTIDEATAVVLDAIAPYS